MFPYSEISESKIRKYLDSVEESSVIASLSSESAGFADLLNLISPVAEGFLHEMRARAEEFRMSRHGNIMKLYMPLYLSSFCVNECVYCGFKKTAEGVTEKHRRRLSIDEILPEAEKIKSFGIDSVLLVSGEDPGMSVEYLEEAVVFLKKMFSYVAIEIYPLSQENYKRLYSAGVHGLTLYQETYNRETYSLVHRKGPKKDFEKRLKAVEDGAKAGFYNIGIGALLGLYDWRMESAFIASHALWLRKHYWKSRIQFSFPRIKRESLDYEIPNPLSEQNLEQMILAFRIAFPECDLSLSTRESCEFRDKVARPAVNIMSAASSVVPGGYSENSNFGLGQFELCDSRTVVQVTAALRKLGLEPVFKDWDKTIG